jgi:DNA-binding IclR family transcriptional regulator
VPSRSTPSVQKAFRILELLAESPQNGVKLSELSRRLELSYATAHSIANSMEEMGYLRRSDTDLRYRLGPGLMALGTASRESYELTDDAILEMERLSKKLQVECNVGIESGDEMLVIARTGPSLESDTRAAIGERLPLAPPLGVSFVAWADSETIESYLSRSPHRMSKSQRSNAKAALKRVRSRGYAVVLDSAALRRLGELAKSLVQHSANMEKSMVDALVADLPSDSFGSFDFRAGPVHGVTAMNAPIFGPDGTVMAVLAINSIDDEWLPADQLSTFADELLATASAIESGIGGVRPSSG